ncbi:hypothetical protein Gotri_026064, partial [Gossypium trilobum]|nr:hypothetical protein [Gossypium trilobum]
MDRLRPHGSQDKRSSPMISGIEGTIEMSKEEFEQRWARKSLRECFQLLRNADFVTMCLTSNRDSMQELLDSQRKKLTERNNALKAIMMALKEEIMVMKMALSIRIEKLEGELALCRIAMGKGVSSATLNNEDVLKPKKFVGTRSACDVDNFLERMENYFHAKGITDDAVKIGTWQEFRCELEGQFYPKFIEEEAREKLQGIKQRDTVGQYVREFKELILQVSDVTKKEALLAFQNGLKLWVKQKVEQRGVQKLSKAMMVAESVVKLGSSKPDERGVCKKDHKEDVVDSKGNGDNG